MITDYLFLSPSGEVMSNLHDIRRYIEEHCADHRLFFRVYRCANTICSASLNTLRLRPPWRRQTA